VSERAGDFPYAAGIHAGGYTTRLWTVRQLAGLRSAEDTNARFKYLLGLGETGLSLAFDLPTQMGLDPLDGIARAEVGLAGVSIRDVDDLASVFAGIRLDTVSVSMTINATAPILTAMLIVVAEEQGVDPAHLRGTVQNEMLKEFLARNATVYDLPTSMRYSIDLLEHCIRYLPGLNGVSISGGHAREAGASRSLEIACAIADAEEYIKQLLDRGLEVDAIAPKLSFILGSHMQLLAEAAKFRVARELYATRVKRLFGATSERSCKMRIQVNTFGSALAYQEPLNNIVRATIQAVAAVLGGVQSLHVCAFDEAHQTPSPLAARVALRTQQILAEETDLPSFVDPLGGSNVVSTISDSLRVETLEWLERIEARGGIIRSIESGWLGAEIDAQAAEAPVPVVGAGPDADVFPEELTLIGTEKAADLVTLRQRRPTGNLMKKAESLQVLAIAASRGENVMRPLIEAVRDRHSLADLTEAMRPAAGRTQEVLQ